MFEDALSVVLGNVRVYAWGLAVMLGFWLGLGVLLRLTRKDQAEHGAAALAAVLSLPLGLLLARLLYCLGDPSFHPFLRLGNILDLSLGGFSMYGALAGAALTALIAARLTGRKASRMLDLAAPALAAFLIPARLGEAFTALGVSRPLTTPWLADSFLAIRDEYDAYLRTWLLEALLALMILLLLLRRLKRGGRDGRVFLTGCLLYGLTQTLMESLRYDGHMRFGFIGVQQALSAALFSGALVVLCVRLLRRGKGGKTLPVLTLCLLPFLLGGIVGVEFMVDRSPLGKLVSYALFIAVLALPLYLGRLMLNREERIGQGTD